MRLLLKEHSALEIKRLDVTESDSVDQENDWFVSIPSKPLHFLRDSRGKEVYPYAINRKDEETYALHADYYVGIDWLIEGEKFIHVEPKINKVVNDAFKELLDLDEDDQSTISVKEDKVEKEVGEIGSDSTPNLREVDFLKMLLEVYSGQVEEKYLKDIVTIYWDENRIPIEQHQDQLTPFLIVQFLQLLKKIVRKGLKKSYYKVQENLNGRVKGKILIGQQLKQNVFKNRLTSTICEYQVFGIDSVENRFLKKVLRFVSSYVDNHPMLFNSNQQEVKNLISYCRPAFELVGEDVEIHQLKHLKANPFFKEYKEAIKIGQYILKRFAYNITHTTEQKVETPPFWIDMPRLFELYVYHQLLKANPEHRGDLHYQFSTYGNALDLLITYDEQPIVVDMKYKLHYKHGHIHQDIRQVSGYARLKKVRDKCKVTDDSNINCLIIYPKVDNADLVDYSLENIGELLKVDEDKENQYSVTPYYKVFKLGIALPMIE
ncbi:restriction endonuclease [Myroides marinus]|uniref:5-methylcytosine restriction system specificity protein McrC n=1 Tax=Myroides marinus TaxID=703342 RepID=UPI0025753437|nr:restriction endonuclease [Myroides marinus]MDM1368325.1 restriction endonuclease [Myroides marinus]MDM1390309.1 restriction endonuclease [Myroides marinus]